MVRRKRRLRKKARKEKAWKGEDGAWLERALTGDNPYFLSHCDCGNTTLADGGCCNHLTVIPVFNGDMVWQEKYQLTH